MRKCTRPLPSRSSGTTPRKLYSSRRSALKRLLRRCCVEQLEARQLLTATTSNSTAELAEDDEAGNGPLESVWVASVSDTTEGLSPGAFVFERSNSNHSLQVHYEVLVDSTATADEDYHGLPGSIDFAVGQQYLIVQVQGIVDTATEPPESVQLRILSTSRPQEVVPSAEVSTLWIHDSQQAVDANSVASTYGSSFTVHSLSHRIARGIDEPRYGLMLQGSVSATGGYEDYDSGSWDDANSEEFDEFDYSPGSEELASAFDADAFGIDEEEIFGIDQSSSILVQIDTDGDGEVDLETLSDAEWNFQTVVAGTAPGVHTFFVRALEWHETEGRYYHGDWASYTLTYAAAPAPAPANLRLRSDTGDSATDRITADPVILGELPLEGVPAGQLQVEVDRDGDSLVDARIDIDEAGQFLYLGEGYIHGSQTLRFRSAFFDPVVGDTSFSPWQSFTFDYQPLSLPELHIELLIDDGESATDRITTVDTLSGTLLPFNSSVTRIEFDIDGDGELDGVADIDSSGHFLFRPGLLDYGPVEVRARAVGNNPYTAQEELGAWSSFAFTLAEPSEEALSIRDLRLLIDTGWDTEDRITTIAAVGGAVGGSHRAAVSHVEIDWDGDGISDAIAPPTAEGNFRYVPAKMEAGVHVLAARAVGYDYATQSLSRIVNRASPVTGSRRFRKP